MCTWLMLQLLDVFLSKKVKSCLNYGNELAFKKKFNAAEYKSGNKNEWVAACKARWYSWARYEKKIVFGPDKMVQSNIRLNMQYPRNKWVPVFKMFAVTSHPILACKELESANRKWSKKTKRPLNFIINARERRKIGQEQ